MKKNYVIPKIALIIFEQEDAIRTSGPWLGENELPIVPFGNSFSNGTFSS